MEKSEINTPEGSPPKEEQLSPKTPEDSPPKASPKSNSKKDFEALIEFYLADNTSRNMQNKNGELEIRFGTNPRSGKPLSKIDYDNVVQSFYSAGYKTENVEGLSILRIQCENLNKKTGQIRMSNIRAEVMGIDLIQEYCRTNNLQKILDLPSTISAVSDKVKFTQKHPPYIGESRETSKPMRPVDFEDFNFRASYQYEKDFYPHTEIAKNILSSWLDSKKIFRYINRVRMRHDELPVFLDVSIVKGSAIAKRRYKKQSRVPIPEYTIQDANVFNNEEVYEVELELDNSRIGMGTEYNTASKILDALRKCIRIVLSSIQGTSYPISNSEKEEVLKSYMETVFGDDYTKEFMEKYNNSSDYIAEKAQRDLTKHFIGPSSYTLQMNNIVTLPEDGQERISVVPNIRENYTVTDKADGDRKMLFVSDNGHIYMIDTNMNIIFTGIVTLEKELFNSLIDGEHIKYDKNNKFVNIYAAFDIYYINKKSVRELNFVALEEEDIPEKFRLPLLNNFVRQLKPRSILNKDSGNSNPVKKTGKVDDDVDHSCWLSIKCKEFSTSYHGDIFKSCEGILSRVKDGSYEYNTDGLIFTPASTGVGGNSSGKAGPLKKITWEHSFKWKPSQYNTIDFLVSVKKDKNGKDEIHNVFQDGVDLQNQNSIVQYKTLILHCGFNKKDHGYINPMLDVINDVLPSEDEKDNTQRYQPVPFQPTNPYDIEAQYCNVELKDNGNGLVMLTEENEYFEENMIVEFSYNREKEGYWRWVPLRVRYDKTNDLRATGSNFGNAYHVANSNWHSIHNPITEEMIMSGKDIPELLGDEDVYYNKTGKETTTRALRNFHNLYVKRKLILGVSNRGDSLIDFAVGKGGDFPKWIASKIDFVFGIDYSKDNIENQKDGACARYLNYRKKYSKMPYALFANGDSGLNIRNGKALVSERDKQISEAVFGNGSKNKEELGDGVYRQFGVGKDGFNVSSCQFALHYFFKDNKTMNSFLRNVSECTKVNGYFIGTCYDGETVFNVLKSKNKGDSMTIYNDDDEKMYEIKKQYSYTGFPEDENSLNYPIEIFQESINKSFLEYLVNFNYLQRILDNYGFTLLTKEEANAIGLPNGSGMFDELYTQMNDEIKQNYKNKNEYDNANKMSLEEKKISFMNRYFVFRKTHHVNAEKVYKLLVNKGTSLEITEEDDTEDIIEKIKKTDEKEENSKEEKPTIVIKRLKGKKRKLLIGDESVNRDGVELNLE
tara:strand:+ start:2311 stop:6000 length:3690 start_codon:yes stop_codon:yes gene_type:complete